MFSAVINILKIKRNCFEAFDTNSAAHCNWLSRLVKNGCRDNYGLFLYFFKWVSRHSMKGICNTKYSSLRAFIGVETAALTFRTKQYSTSYSSHICCGKRFSNDFFLNHHTIALVHNCLKLLRCVVIETALDLMKNNQLS